MMHGQKDIKLRENVNEESQTKRTAHKVQDENGEVFFIEF